MSGKHATVVVPADETGLATAIDVLAAGGLVAVPTETVYGLAARADSHEAVARIYAAKARPGFNPLIVHVRDLDHVRRFGVFADAAEELAQTYWPGPLTLVIPKREDAELAAAITAGLPTIAVRVPAHPVMRRLLAAVDFPVAAPSANRSGFISPTCAEHVLASLDGRIDLVLDGGATPGGVESTILAVRSDGSIDELRSGPVSTPDWQGMVGLSVRSGEMGGIEAPGQLGSHYAPGKPVRLNATCAAHDEFMIGFGEVEGDVNLSARGDLEEAASRLYAYLHDGARASEPKIAVAPVPNDGLGRAVNDRLKRAAAPTP